MITNYERSPFNQMINMQKELINTITKNTSFHDQIAKACEAITSSHKSIIDSMKPFIEQQTELANKITKTFISFPKIELPESYITQISRIAEDLSNSFKTIKIPDFKSLSKRISELPAETKAALILLGKNGWYLNLDMELSQLHAIEKELMSNNISAVDDFLIKYYEENIDEIEKNICTLYPNRAKIISKAFSAHRNKDFELSIPVFLAQADGISKEKIDYYIFLKKDKKPETAQYVESLAIGGFQRSLLAPLTEILPIMKSEKDRGPTFTELNRHMVLHGESIDYGTHLFGCKSISLIDYIGNVLK